MIFLKILILIVTVIIGIFVIVFIAGFFVASRQSSTKKLHEWAKKVILNELSNNERNALEEIWLGFKQKNPKEAKETFSKLQQKEAENLRRICNAYYRPINFSSGKLMDTVSWISNYKTAIKNGFGKGESEIIAGIIMNGYEIVCEMQSKNDPLKERL